MILLPSLPLLSTLIPLAAGAACAAPAPKYTDYFFKFNGGTSLINDQRLRGNNSFDFFSPGAVNPPFNPADHYNRISTNATVPSKKAILLIVPTNPHPPPVPGYYGLSGKEGVPDAYRLLASYRPEDEGEGYKFKEWELVKSKSSGKVLLRYSGDAAGEWRWIARREKVSDGPTGEKNMDKWVPWYVKPSGKNVKVLETWDYRAVELELEMTKCGVNSGAPGGVDVC